MSKRRDAIEFQRGSLYGSMLMMSYTWPFAAYGILAAMGHYPSLWVLIAIVGWFAFNILALRFYAPMLIRIAARITTKRK